MAIVLMLVAMFSSKTSTTSMPVFTGSSFTMVTVPAFRNLESAVAAELGKENGQVIATGGGAVLRAQNVRALRQNGVVVYIDRPLGQLAVGGARPLSQSAEALAAMHAARAPLYACLLYTSRCV